MGDDVMLREQDFRRLDEQFLAWVRQQPETRQCLFCTNAATDWCHVEHGSSRQSDYMGFPACNGHHMMLDHTPRGSAPMVKDGTVRKALAYWFTFGLANMLRRYRCETR